MTVFEGCRLIESLTQLVNIAIKEECVPADRRKSYVMPLFKSGILEIVTRHTLFNLKPYLHYS